jgi:hypothetical protein
MLYDHSAFENGLYLGEELVNAHHAHARMGYNFYVSAVTVQKLEQDANDSNSTVDITAKVVQVGVAPFYYDLA